MYFHFLLPCDSICQTYTCLKSTIESLEKSVKYARRSNDFIVNFEHIPDLFYSVFFVDFEQVNVSEVFSFSNNWRR